jgi:hypothetical protein
VRLFASLSRLIWLLCVVTCPLFAHASDDTPGPKQRKRGVFYSHDKIADVPWSIHVLKIERGRPDLEFHTTLAKGATIGLSTMTEQMKTLPPELGKPIAAINGDFWKDGRQPEGDPEGLQIMRGELISAPGSRSCFWIDADGQPHATNVLAQFKITWPNHTVTSVGLNEERSNDGAVLYTSAMGPSTRTRKGRELILEREGNAEWLPMRAGQTLAGRVREVREAGNSLISTNTVVLSLSPSLTERIPTVAPGAILKIAMESTPDLHGVKTAIGGGPTLVRAGKALNFTTAPARHPRTAIGWNEKFFFFVVVDGRQPGLSVGMTLQELASYMIKQGCQEALNFDGGGSATFWVYGNVMNSPCYGHERPMANALVLVQKPKTQNGSLEATIPAAPLLRTPRPSP